MKTRLEILLGEWGAWKRGENRSALGLPAKSVFQNMRVDGMRSPEPDVPLVDDELRRVDDWIDTLYPDAKAVVVAQYVWPGVVKQKIERLGLSRPSYYFRLEFAMKQLDHLMYGATTKVSRHVAQVSR